jgi:transposase
MAAIFVAEIGDVSRFPTPQHLCSWAGLTPKHSESDTKVHRGRITKMGSHLVRWAAVEAVVRYHGGDPIRPAYRRIAERRGTKVARVAAARRLLTLVYVRHEAPSDRAGWKDPPVGCRSSPLKREAA